MYRQLASPRAACRSSEDHTHSHTGARTLPATWQEGRSRASSVELQREEDRAETNGPGRLPTGSASIFPVRALARGCPVGALLARRDCLHRTSLERNPGENLVPRSHAAVAGGRSRTMQRLNAVTTAQSSPGQCGPDFLGSPLLPCPRGPSVGSGLCPQHQEMATTCPLPFPSHHFARSHLTSLSSTKVVPTAEPCGFRKPECWAKVPGFPESRRTVATRWCARVDCHPWPGSGIKSFQSMDFILMSAMTPSSSASTQVSSP